MSLPGAKVLQYPSGKMDLNKLHATQKNQDTYETVVMRDQGLKELS